MVTMDRLCRGIFWIKDTKGFSDTIVVKAECDVSGAFVKLPNMSLLSRSGEEFNHKAAWDTLPKSKTENKPYNYYPRGRVQIKNGCAVIYANASIVNDKLRKWAVGAFNLSKENGINNVILKADMSNHYLCYLDWSD